MTDRMAEIESAGTDLAASSRLEQIRASMAGELEAGSGSEGASGNAAPEAIEAPEDADVADTDVSDAEAYLSADPDKN